MAAGGEKTSDFYAVLGLKKECSEAELRNAYKKLALRWHPDRCSASGNLKFVQEAKEKFQVIQEAYSVLSDFNKRFLYDVGVLYDNDDEDDDDDDENGMGDFLGEMAQMMSQTKPGEKGHESFEELQQLFVDMFQADLDVGFGGPAAGGTDCAATNSSSSPSWNGNSCSNKRGCSVMNSEGEGEGKLDELNIGPGGFCYGSTDSRDPLKGRGGGHSKQRSGRQQKLSSKHDVSSRNATISF